MKFIAIFLGILISTLYPAFAQTVMTQENEGRTISQNISELKVKQNNNAKKLDDISDMFLVTKSTHIVNGVISTTTATKMETIATDNNATVLFTDEQKIQAEMGHILREQAIQNLIDSGDIVAPSTK